MSYVMFHVTMTSSNGTTRYATPRAMYSIGYAQRRQRTYGDFTFAGKVPELYVTL